MTEINHYEELLKEKENEIFEIEKKLGEKDIKIENLQQILSFNSQFLMDIQTMNKMIEKKTKKGNAPSRDESLEIQTFKESLEPETMNDFSQVTRFPIIFSLSIEFFFKTGTSNAKVKGKHWYHFERQPSGKR